MFITAVCVLFLIKLRWPTNKNPLEFVIIFLHFLRPDGVRNCVFVCCTAGQRGEWV